MKRKNQDIKFDALKFQFINRESLRIHKSATWKQAQEQGILKENVYEKGALKEIIRSKHLYDTAKVNEALKLNREFWWIMRAFRFIQKLF